MKTYTGWWLTWEKFKPFIICYGVNLLVQMQREMWSITKSELKNNLKIYTSTELS